MRFREEYIQSTNSVSNIFTAKDEKVKLNLAPEGKWIQENDFVQWTYTTSQLYLYAVQNVNIIVAPGKSILCMMRRNYFGSWCGYVGVRSDSPLFGLDYNLLHEFPMEPIWVHGGLTFGEIIKPAWYGGDIQEKNLFYKPFKAGRPPKMYFFGFDCAHHNDFTPLKALSVFTRGAYIYRDEEYVKEQTCNLANSIIRIEEGIKQKNPLFLSFLDEIKKRKEE